MRTLFPTIYYPIRNSSNNHQFNGLPQNVTIGRIEPIGKVDRSLQADFIAPHQAALDKQNPESLYGTLV
jgi:hypothetical protein